MKDFSKPRVSLSKLAEFTYAASSRRETIVREQMKKEPFKAAGYKEAEDFVPKFLQGQQDDELLTQQIKNLIALNGLRPTKSLANSINGLVALGIAAPFDFGEVEVQPIARNYHGGISIEDVYISMRPDAVISKMARGQLHVGTIKLHFPKSHPPNDQSGKCAAVLLHECLQNLTVANGERKHDLCFYADVHSAALFAAPKNFKLVMKDVHAACVQYKLMWDSMLIR